MAVTTAVRLLCATPAGKTKEFTRILGLSLESDRFTPADALTCRVLDRLNGGDSFSTMTLWLQGEKVFDGIVDVQSTHIGQGGQFAVLRGRSRGALMLDNEVKPASYQGFSSEQLLRDHAFPYGVAEAKLPHFCVLPQVYAKKGLSHWGMIEQFCMAAYRRRPYLSREGVLTCRPFGDGMKRFSNRERDAVPFLDAEICRDRYRMISKLSLKTGKDEAGGTYRYLIRNSLAEAEGVIRERYCHPPAAWQHQPEAAGRAVMEQRQMDSFEITTTVPGLLAVSLGDGAEFDDGAGWHKDLYVSQVRLVSDEGGSRTKVKLWRKGLVS